MMQQPIPKTRYQGLALDPGRIRGGANIKGLFVPSTIDSILIAHSLVVRFATDSRLAVGMVVISLLGVYGNFPMVLRMSKEI